LSETAALDSTSGLVINIQTAESDDVSPGKPKLKRKNMTTVRVQLLYNDIILNYISSRNFRIGFHIVKPVYLSCFSMMVWLAIWAMTLVLVVDNKLMPAGNVYIVLMVVYCNAEAVCLLPMLHTLYIRLR
jgi:hypothetical protein